MIIGGAVLAVLLVFYAFMGREVRESLGQKWANIPGDVSRWVPDVRKIAGRYNVPEKVALGVLWVENAGTMLPRGEAGEYGIMQVKEIAVKDLRLNGYQVPDNWREDPIANITVGIQFLDLQAKRTGRNWDEALRAYNQGYKGKDMTEVKSKRADEYLTKVERKMNQLPYG